MDYADYHVLYVDNRMSQDLNGKLLQRSPPEHKSEIPHSSETPSEDKSPDHLLSILGELEEVRCNIRSVLSVFNGGMSTSSHFYCTR